MTGEMKAAVALGAGILETRTLPRPTAGDGLLLRVTYCGVCGSDRRQVLTIRKGSEKIVGHEVVGTVVSAAQDLASWRGKRVGVAPRIGCGSCYSCKKGRVNLCSRPTVIGYQLPGGFAQFLSLPRRAVTQGNVVEIPEELDDRTAALAEPLSCVINGLGLSRVSRGSTVTVIGAGPMGQMFVLLSGRIADRTYVVEPDGFRRRFAEQHGATKSFETAEDVPPTDIVIVACSSPDAYEAAFEIASEGSVINLFGGLDQPFPFDLNRVHYRELTVHGTSGSTPAHFKEALRILSENPMFGDLVSHVVPFSTLPAAINSPKSLGPGVMKVLLDPWVVEKPAS